MINDKDIKLAIEIIEDYLQKRENDDCFNAGSYIFKPDLNDYTECEPQIKELIKKFKKFVYWNFEEDHTND